MRVKALRDGRYEWVDQGQGNGTSWDQPKRGAGSVALYGELVQGEAGSVERARALRRVAVQPATVRS